jgi:hypothetical protein
LKDEERTIAEANEELKRLLQRRRLSKLPPGTVLEGRRYEEELYIFEE